MMYVRLTLSLRWVEDLLFERGIDICHEAVCFWWNRLSAMYPGLIRPPTTERWINDPQMRKRVLADSPIRRAAELEEITGLLLFPASDLTDAIAGAAYSVGGAHTPH